MLEENNPRLSSRVIYSTSNLLLLWNFDMDIQLPGKEIAKHKTLHIIPWNILMRGSALKLGRGIVDGMGNKIKFSLLLKK